MESKPNPNFAAGPQISATKSAENGMWLQDLQLFIAHEASRHRAAAGELDHLIESLTKFLGTLSKLSESPVASERAKGGNDKLDVDALDSLPWVDFVKGNGQWVKAETSGAERLRAFLEKSPVKSLEAGRYFYRLSGSDGAFINRFANRRK